MTLFSSIRGRQVKSGQAHSASLAPNRPTQCSGAHDHTHERALTGIALKLCQTVESIRVSARVILCSPSLNLAGKINVDVCHAPIMPRIRRYVGMNESTPTTAPPSTSRAGLTLYCTKIIRAPTAIAAVSTPKIAPLAIVKQPASKSPIEMGASPC
jgi:hypothetical protein